MSLTLDECLGTVISAGGLMHPNLDDVLVKGYSRARQTLTRSGSRLINAGSLCRLQPHSSSGSCTILPTQASYLQGYARQAVVMPVLTSELEDFETRRTGGQLGLVGGGKPVYRIAKYHKRAKVNTLCHATSNRKRTRRNSGTRRSRSSFGLSLLVRRNAVRRV